MLVEEPAGICFNSKVTAEPGKKIRWDIRKCSQLQRGERLVAYLSGLLRILSFRQAETAAGTTDSSL
jgi:hypothetical protein